MDHETSTIDSPLHAALERYPRVPLAHTPTPLTELPRLGDQLGVRLFIKRDDLTGLALGGDKPRKLEYELGRAVDAGADTIVTCGSSQSNHARLTTAAARTVGMDCAVVLSRDAYTELQGNLLITQVLGAQVHIVDTDDHWDLEADAHALCDRLRRAGRRPYYVPISGTTAHSCLGYVRAGLELAAQLSEHDIRPDAVYTPFGTGGIFAGLLLACRHAGLDAHFVGISVNRDHMFCQENLNHWWTALRELLDIPTQPSQGGYEIDDNFVGREYGDPTVPSLDAILRLARTEGILLDPVYSGKMAAGFLGHHASGRWNHNQTVVLVHSGGTPALFAYHDALAQHLARR